MALGTPVVATSKGVEGLEVVHGRHLLIADEPARFAHYVLQLLRDRALGERLAMNARRLVEDKYDWKQICDCFLCLIEDAVADRQRRHHAFETRLFNE
jgi:glycosyltransferase involved in cell wall biosynthesis